MLTMHKSHERDNFIFGCVFEFLPLMGNKMLVNLI